MRPRRLFGECALALFPLVTLAPTGAATQEVTAIRVGETRRVESSILEEWRTVHVGLPRSHGQTSHRYPTIYVLDGEASFLPTYSAARFLAANGLAPECLVVAVENTDRTRDMTPADMRVSGVASGGAERFLDFFERELVPLVAKDYRGGAGRILIGHSHGGILGTYALAQRPRLFAWHLSIDPPIHLDEEYLARHLVAFLEESPEHIGRLVSAERTFGWGSAWDSLLEAAPPGFRAARFALPDETHETMVYEATYEGLKRLFHGYRSDQLDAHNLAQLSAVQAELAGEFGFPVEISRRSLVFNADELVSLSRGVEARELVEHAIERYGTNPALEELLVKAVEAERVGPPTETVEEIVALPRATPKEMQPFLGTWKGVYASEDGSTRQPVHVVFEVRDGKVVGRTHLRRPNDPDAPLDKGLEHVLVRVLAPGRLEFGYVNNKRPRGVLVSDATLTEDGALVGKWKLRGAVLELPPGVELPVISFRLERVE